MSENVYEIQMTATIQRAGMCIRKSNPRMQLRYPQVFISIKIHCNFDGKVKEVGMLEKFKDKELNLTTSIQQ